MTVLPSLREEVLAANCALPAHGLTVLTWGNASGIDRDRGLVVIKPTGVAFEALTAADLVVVDLDGHVVEGSLRPSSDTPTHLELYRAFPDIGGVVHTHSTYATVFAQAGRPLPLLGTTHADLSPRAVPLARQLAAAEIAQAYEESTGRALVEAVGAEAPLVVPAVLAAGHGPFAWGTSALAAVETALTLEVVAKMALFTLLLAPDAPPLAEAVRDKHYERKHGPHAYYGQSHNGGGEHPAAPGTR